MLQTYSKRFDSFKENFLNECFSVIGECVSTQPHSLLIGGNYALTMDFNADGKYVPYMYQIPFGCKDPKEIEKCTCVELYSDDGYSEIKDIAYWTDIANDMIKAQAAKCDVYNSQRKDNTIKSLA